MTAPQTLPTSAAEADAMLEGLDEGNEAPETATPDAVETASPAPAETDQPRDVQGRFTSPAPSPDPSAPVPEGPAVAPPAGESAVPIDVPVADTPWTIAGDGQPFTIEGSDVGEDGRFIPAAQAPRIERLIQQGLAWEGSAQRYFQQASQRQQATEQRAKAAEEQVEAARAESAHILGTLETLIEKSLDYPDEKLWESPIGQWLLGRRNEWPVLKAEAKSARIEREGQAAQQRLQEYESQRQEAELRPQMDRTLSDHILYYGQQHGLNRDVMEDIYATLHSPEYQGVTWIKAPQDDPIHGISKGETVLNVGIIEREVTRTKRWVSPAAPNGQPKAQTPPAAPAKKVPPPPTVAAARGPSPQKARPVYKNREEADEALASGMIDID